VPTTASADVALDFIEGLPKVGGKSIILTVMDRFSKYCHFIPLGHPYTTETVAKLFFAEIVWLHDILRSLVSNYDPMFTSTFWKEILTLSSAKLHMTMALHPQAEGQVGAANKVITMYLRCFTGDRPWQWLRWLPWAKYAHNTTFQSSLRDMPFKLVYGRDPPMIRSYEPGESRVMVVAKSMAEHKELLSHVRYRLNQAQAVYKKFYDCRHCQVSRSETGCGCGFATAHPSLPSATKGKLWSQYYGPYQVSEVINVVAVRLELPARARIHNIFHIGFLKQFTCHPPDHLHLCLQCITAQQFRFLRQRSRLVWCVRQVVIQCAVNPHLRPPGRMLKTSSSAIQHFSPRMSCSSRGGRDVMWGKWFTRRSKKAGTASQESG
jgi:hypothetical protein